MSFSGGTVIFFRWAPPLQNAGLAEAHQAAVLNAHRVSHSSCKLPIALTPTDSLPHTLVKVIAHQSGHREKSRKPKTQPQTAQIKVVDDRHQQETDELPCERFDEGSTAVFHGRYCEFPVNMNQRLFSDIKSIKVTFLLNND
jgi:hypothetical protein